MSVARNTAYLTAASVAQKILAFAYFTAIARAIGVQNTGRYSFALAFSAIFSVVTDLGFTSVMVRDLARSLERVKEYLGTVLATKLVFSVAAYGLLALAINLMGYPAETKTLVYLTGTMMILDAVALTFFGVFRATKNLRFEAIGVVIWQVVTITVGGAVLILRLPLPMLMLSLVAGSLFNVIWSGYLLMRVLGIRPAIRWNKSVFWAIVPSAIPFALAGIFTKVYSYVDSVFLSYLVGDEAVAWYSIPYKLIFAFQFIPMALSAALYPTMSYYYSCSRERLAETFERSMRYLIILAVPLAVGIAAIADTVVLTVYGEAYRPSILPLRILSASLLFAFLDFPVGAILNACERQSRQMWAMGITMVVNVCLNLVLIPRYTVVGASIAALASYALLMGLGLFWARNIAPIRFRVIARSLARVILAASVMAAAVLLLKERIPGLLTIPIGAAVYAVALLALREVTRADLPTAKRMISREGA